MEQGISQAELAKRIGVNEMTVVNWEIRNKIPRIKSHIKTLKNLIPEVDAIIPLYEILYALSNKE